MTRHILCISLILVSLLIVGCGSGPQKYMLSKEDAQQQREVQNTQLANPASMHCMNETGNSLVMREDATGGQYGVCIFSDGSWCEEWAYYREECRRGTNMTECGTKYDWKSACPPDYNPVCANVRIGDNVTYRMVKRNYNNACTACKMSEGNQTVLGYNIGVCDE